VGPFVPGQLERHVGVRYASAALVPQTERRATALGRGGSRELITGSPQIRAVTSLPTTHYRSARHGEEEEGVEH
jgi:hypothetical protein